MAKLSFTAGMQTPALWQLRWQLRRATNHVLSASRRDQFIRMINGPAAAPLRPPPLRALGNRIWCWYREVKPLTQPLAGKTVCLFAHFDRDGLVEDYVLYHLACLQRTGAVIVFFTTGPALAATEINKLEPYCAAIVERENRGLDFGSWRTALLMYPQLAECQTLIVTNDSVYGPLSELGPTISKMAASGCDYWAATESRQIKFHYQSYFMAFHQSCLRHRAFRAECDNIALLGNKDEIVYIHEVCLKQRLAAHKLRGSAVVPIQPYLGLTDNPMFRFWRQTLLAGGPYIKVLLLRDNPHRQPLDDWPVVVSTRGYDPSLIARHHHLPKNAELVCFCDYDDIWLPHKLARQRAVLRDPEVALCHTDLAVVDARGKQLHPSCFLLERRNLDDYSLPQLILRNSVTGSTLAIRATLLPRLLPFPFQGPSPRFYHDHWTALHATLVGRIVAIREPLVHYRQHDGNQLGAAPARAAWRVARQQGLALLCRHPHLHLWSVEREWTLRQEWIKLLLKRAPSTPRPGARLDALAGWLQRRLGLVQLGRFVARHLIGQSDWLTPAALPVLLGRIAYDAQQVGLMRRAPGPHAGS